MGNRPLTPGAAIANNTTVVVTVALTQGLYVKTAGVVSVAGPNTTPINMGSVVAGTVLDFAITQVGTDNTAILIPLR